MTELAFHFNIPDKVAYVCRLLRKAASQNVPVVVVAAPALLRKLDAALWQLSATDFLGHVCECGDAPGQQQPPDAATQALGQCARIRLVCDASDSPVHEVLVNLLPDVPAGFEQFARLVEIVSLEENDKTAARMRWRHYSSRGYPIQRQDVQVKSAS